MSLLLSFDVGVVFGCGEGAQKSIIRRIARAQSSMTRRYKSGVALPRMGWAIYSVLMEFLTNSILQWQMKPSVNRLFPNKDCIFQQDNDPKHTAHSIRNYLANYEVPTLPWPSQSPDLNPIENLWSILDMKVKDRSPKNKKQFFEVLQVAWQSLEPELLTKLADSMPNRIEAVIAAKGYSTKY